MHDHDVVRQAHDQFDVVFDEKNGDAAGQRLDQPIELRRFGRRHALRRLVEHQQFRIERHADRDFDPALVAVREIPHQFAGAVG